VRTDAGSDLSSIWVGRLVSFVPTKSIKQKTRLPHPDAFLAVRVQRGDLVPPLTGVCAGYELNEWRCKQLASHLMEWLPEFALTPSECDAVRAHNAVALVGQAARTIYASKKASSGMFWGFFIGHNRCRLPTSINM
jgi:hypothetical protein